MLVLASGIGISVIFNLLQTLKPYLKDFKPDIEQRPPSSGLKLELNHFGGVNANITYLKCGLMVTKHLDVNLFFSFFCTDLPEPCVC